MIDFINFLSGDDLFSWWLRLRLETNIFNMSLVIFSHNGGLKWRRIIIRGNTWKTTHLSKSVRNQQTVHSNLATNKKIPYRNNPFNSEIQKHHYHYQVIISSLLLRTMCQMCNAKEIVWHITVLPPKCLVIESITNRKNKAEAFVTKSVTDKIKICKFQI